MTNKALLTSRSKPGISTTMSQRMMSKHLCPDCSYVLLRHVRLGELYWRCSHCHREMPL